jgi:hypothetical protein
MPTVCSPAIASKKPWHYGASAKILEQFAALPLAAKTMLRWAMELVNKN